MNTIINKRKLQSIETEKNLLKTAVRLIEKNGYNNVSVDRICREAKVAKGTFYLYFKSKTDILLEILSEINVEMFKNKTWVDSVSPEQQLIEYTHCYLGVVTQQGHEFSKVILKIIMDESPNPLRVHANLHSDHISDILENGRKQGFFNTSISAEDQTMHIQSLLFGIILSWCSRSASFDIQEQGRMAVESFIKGLIN